MRGRPRSGIAGGRTRRGPTSRPNGPARVVNTGSVISTIDAVRTRNVEWPMKVTAACPGSTRTGGGGCGWSAADAGHAARSRVRIHRQTSASERPEMACGLKKRSPSQ